MDPSSGSWRMSHLGFQVEEPHGVVKPGASRTLGAGANHLRFGEGIFGREVLDISFGANRKGGGNL